MMESAKIIELSGADFEDAVADETPAVVEFFADWCAPCAQIGEAFRLLQEELGARVRFYRVNADAESALSEHYRITTLPTVVVFQNGVAMERTVGPKTKRALLELIERVL